MTSPLILPAGEYAVTEPVWLSKCCGKPAQAEGQVTQFWRCTGCGNPCDAVPAVTS